MDHMVSILQNKIQKPFYWVIRKHGTITSLYWHIGFLISGFEKNILFYS